MAWIKTGCDKNHPISCIRTVSSIVILPFLIPVAKMDNKAVRCRQKLHILDIFTAYKEQFGNSLLIILLTAHPFEQDEARKNKRSAADSKVIVYPMEFPAKLQK